LAATTVGSATESDRVSFFMNDLKLLEDNYWRQLFTMISQVVMIIGTLGYALYNNALITLVFLAFMVVPSLAPKLFGKTIQAKTATWSAKNQTLSGTVHDLFHGALLLKRFAAIHGFDGRLHHSVTAMETANANMKNRIALANQTITVLYTVFTDVPIALGIYLTITGYLTLAQFVAIQYSSNWVLNGFNGLVSGWNVLNSTKSLRTKLIQQCGPELPAVADTTPATVQDLSVQHLDFAYDQKPIFRDLGLQVHAGDKILIRGQSGIGKSTLIRLLLRELAPSGGSLQVNGQPYSQESAYQWFGIVGQDPVIFQDTLKANVTLGQPVSDAAVGRALTTAGLAAFASPTKLTQPISENGTNLSGGQLKRLEVARALFFNRQILLIDEGTASLDPETAAAIHRQILTNPAVTVIEVDHHIPSDIQKQYTAVYELRNHQLQPVV